MSKKKAKMQEALNWCNENDKSTEFTIEFIASEANCTHDEAMEFLISKRLTTMSEFKYGDMVEVRDYVTAEWEGPVFYLGSVSLPKGRVRHHTMGFGQDESNFNECAVIWYHIRKPEPAPECKLTIEERLERIEAALAKLQKP